MKTTVCCVIIASLVLLVGATVWEGVSGVDSASDKPGNYSVATNSFPQNTVVDITNLENGKVVRAVVISGLDATGFLAKMSRNTADSLDLRGKSICRIRMTQPVEAVAFVPYRLGPVDSSVNDTAGTISAGYQHEAETPLVMGASVMSNETPFAEKTVMAAPPAETASVAGDSLTNNETFAEKTAAVPAPVKMPAEPGKAPDAIIAEAPLETITAVITETSPELWAGADKVEFINETPDYTAAIKDETAPYLPAAHNETVKTADPEPATVAVNAPEPQRTAETITIVSAEERLPPMPPSRVAVPSNAVPPGTAAQTHAAYTPQANFSPFQAPLIDRMEKGKWYVQVGVYTRPDHVEDEISKIGTGYPLAIQNVGTETNPLFRVLLGPFNLNESGAMLERFKNIGYTDAFVRNN